jgi:hypothetical protein
MRGRCNHDLIIEAPLNGKPEPSRMPDSVKGDREQLAAGYATLDQASTGEYSDKERRGLSRDANYPRRY